MISKLLHRLNLEDTENPDPLLPKSNTRHQPLIHQPRVQPVGSRENHLRRNQPQQQIQRNVNGEHPCSNNTLQNQSRQDSGEAVRHQRGRRGRGGQTTSVHPPQRHGNGARSNESLNGQRRYQSADRARRNENKSERTIDVLNYGRMRNYEKKDPATILVSLAHEYSGLRNLLNLPRQKSDMVKLTLSVLSKACQCESSPQNLNSVLIILPDSIFFTVGVINVLMEASHAPDETENSRKLITDICHVLQKLYVRIPWSCAALVGVTTILQGVVDDFRESTDVIDEDVLRFFNVIEELKETTLLKLKANRQPRECRVNVVEEGSPPDDFRDISLLPELEELKPNYTPFLRRNKKVGSYDSVNDYLDVQFRLLREDFIQPLRDGIGEYQTILQGSGKRGQKPQNIRIYPDVTIVRSVCSRTDLLHRLHFDVSKLKKVKWEVSKRLIYGSLVCLSSNNFDTFFVATVSDRSPKQLSDGYIDVKFEDNLDEINSIETERQFVMVETMAYYEAYKHVLKGLQQITDLPFEKYIVRCQSSVDPPRYLTEQREALFDLRPLVDDKTVLREDSNLRRQGREEAYNFSSESRRADKINVMDSRAWPGHELLNLDESQYKALQTALTKEFSVIQGPPGTGKTYVGLKIVKALLHNSKLWNPVTENPRPMLIVCYTNHALDQFLEGILTFYKGKVIRVGGRISSSQLEEYSLKAWKKKSREQGQFKDLSRLSYIHNDKLRQLHTQIEYIGQRLEAAESDILTEDELRPVMSSKHSTQLEITKYQSMLAAMGYMVPQLPSLMAEWLGIGITGELSDSMINDTDDAYLDETEMDEDVVDVQDEGQFEANKRMLDGDEHDNDKEFDRIIKDSVKAKRACVAFDISNLDKSESNLKQHDGFQLPRQARRKLKRKLRQYLKSNRKMNQPEADAVKDIWQIDIKARWRLYRHWVSKHTERLKLHITDKSKAYKETCEAQKEVNLIKDRNIISSATIIAMTTTGAARYHTILQEINPRIIVVEEAAEVLEGHIITTLTRRCEQLILIGDHKQLKPNPNVYTLAIKYNLEVSLFERMLNNGVHCDCLELQHRMRPEISKLMKPIYPTLRDHMSVQSFEQVKGVSTNIYFLNHGFAEEHDDEIKSHSNSYEARFVMKLVDYLLKQGYNNKQLTVLTAYSGQLFQLKKLMPKSRFEGVRVTAVDNFQGEENDIIILSLVRSNEQGKIGFLKIENRICVALSRAKKGLFVIGNFDLMASNSPIWKEMTIILKRAGEFGDKLLLQCQNHPEDPGIEIVKPEDFDKAPGGGCQKLCSARLDCGHACVMACHPTDQNHEEYKCTKSCTKLCVEGHPCKRKCFQECGNCETKVLKTIPHCGHLEMVNCSKSEDQHKCLQKCIKILGCHHICANLCGYPHQCKSTIRKLFVCGHTRDVLCVQQDDAVCDAPCNKTLACGHICLGTCSKCFKGKLHIPCQQKCTKNLVCEHKCESTCSNCPPCKKKCGNSCEHSRCKKDCGESCPRCQEPCLWTCEHFSCGKKCYQPCDRPPCNRPCKKKLKKCNHDCIGLCGEPCPRKCRICDKDEVTEIFFGTEDKADARFVELKDCKHVIEYTSLDKWMQLDTSSSTTNIIHLKCCPKCKTPIRRCVRYGTLINSVLSSIDEIKQKFIGNRATIEQLREDIRQNIKSHINDYLHLDIALFTALNKLRDILDKCRSENEFIAVQNQIRFLEQSADRLVKLYKVEENLRPLSRLASVEFKQRKQSYISFIEWLTLTRIVFSEQEIEDAQNEVSRLSLMTKLFHLDLTIEKRGLQIPDTLSRGIKQQKKQFDEDLPMSPSDKATIKVVFKRLEELVPASGLGITEDERVMITKAIGLTNGHWFKCKNGHVYAIGECGGATEEGTCPDCKATIGGTGHRLRDGNALAGEMDGARHAAWSEQTNLNNYGFDALH